MRNKKIAGWVTAVATTGMVALGGAHLAISAQEEIQERQERGFGRGPQGVERGGFMRWRMLRELDLTEDQKSDLKKMRESHFEQNENQQGSMRKAHEAFREATKAFEKGNITEGELYQAAQAMTDAQYNAAIARAGLRAQFLEILTEEQKAELTKLEAEAEAFMKERREQRKERMPRNREERPRKSQR